MKNQIFLYNQKNKLIAKSIIDEENYEWLNNFSWHLHHTGYAETAILLNNKWKTKTMHQLIMGKPPIDQLIDHINRNKLDNRKQNLRFVSRKESCLNRNVWGKVKYKGININRISKNGIIKYEASIKINGKRKYLGIGYNAEKLYKKLYVPAYIKEYGHAPI